MGASQWLSPCAGSGTISAGAAFGAFGRDAPYLVGAIVLFIGFLIASGC